MTEDTGSLEWDAMMDALEANWRVKIADTQDEYQSEYLTLYGTRFTPGNNESASD